MSLFKNILCRFFHICCNENEDDEIITTPTTTPTTTTITTTITTTPIIYTNLWPKTLHIFCEASDAQRYDSSGIHSKTIIHAIKGKSKVSPTIRLIHPWYNPYKISPSDATMISWFKEAKNSGCIAVSVDWEGYLKSLSETSRLVRIANQISIPLILVPKWTLDPSGVFYCEQPSDKRVVSILSGFKVPALLPWLYMGNAEWRISKIQTIYRDNGYTGQIIGMTDGGMREGGTDNQGNHYNTVNETWDFMNIQASKGESVGLFNIPENHKSLKFALNLYKP